MNEALYVLKHKDLDVALVEINTLNGLMEHLVDIYRPEELPVGCGRDGRLLAEWWQLRAIPDSRRGLQQVLNYVDERTSRTLMLSAYGLSLSDHYWMQPVEEELYWRDLNFYENDFSDELGDLLTDTGTIDVDGNISKFSPSSTAVGEMKKKWIIRGGKRLLMKISTNDFGQQTVNEAIASRMHHLTGWKAYVPYELDRAAISGESFPCALSTLFTSTELEFVSAYQLLKNKKVPNDRSNYEALIAEAVQCGLEEETVRGFLEYMILTDFVVSNTDRHFNNFGFLYDSAKKKLVSMAPIFDTGNSLFYNQDVIPSGEYLLDLRVTSFCRREADMLKYVRCPDCLELSCLETLPEYAEELLLKSTGMPAGRAAAIAGTIREKLKYLESFQHGAKLWKKEKYR